MIKKIGIIFGSLLVIGCATTKSAETSSSSSSPKKIEKKGVDFGKGLFYTVNHRPMRCG